MIDSGDFDRLLGPAIQKLNDEPARARRLLLQDPFPYELLSGAGGFMESFGVTAQTTDSVAEALASAFGFADAVPVEVGVRLFANADRLGPRFFQSLPPSTEAVPVSVVEEAVRFIRTLPTRPRIPQHHYNTNLEFEMTGKVPRLRRFQSRLTGEPAEYDGGTVVEVAMSAVFLAGVAAVCLQMIEDGYTGLRWVENDHPEYREVNPSGTDALAGNNDVIDSGSIDLPSFDVLGLSLLQTLDEERGAISYKAFEPFYGEVDRLLHSNKLNSFDQANGDYNRSLTIREWGEENPAEPRTSVLLSCHLVLQDLLVRYADPQVDSNLSHALELVGLLADSTAEESAGLAGAVAEDLVAAMADSESAPRRRVAEAVGWLRDNPLDLTSSVAGTGLGATVGGFAGLLASAVTTLYGAAILGLIVGTLSFYVGAIDNLKQRRSEK